MERKGDKWECGMGKRIVQKDVDWELGIGRMDEMRLKTSHNFPSTSQETMGVPSVRLVNSRVSACGVDRGL